MRFLPSFADLPLRCRPRPAEVEACVDYLVRAGAVSKASPELQREVELQLWLSRVKDVRDAEAAGQPRRRRERIGG